MNTYGSSLTLALAVLFAAPIGAEAPPPPRPSEASRQPSPDVEQAPHPEQGQTLCGLPALHGESLPVIVGDGECGVEAPVLLVSAANVALDPPAVVSCETGRALASWLQDAAIPGFAAAGADLRELSVADAYSCRNRNRAASGKLSEHAKGNAIDIGAFRLDGDRAVTVLKGWNTPDWGPTLSRLRQGACGPFTTVLGPGSNALHADHFHFDVEQRRSPWCE